MYLPEVFVFFLNSNIRETIALVGVKFMKIDKSSYKTVDTLCTVKKIITQATNFL